MSYSDLYEKILGGGGGGFGSFTGQLMSYNKNLPFSIGGSAPTGLDSRSAADQYLMREQLPYMADLEKARIAAGASVAGHAADMEKQRRGFVNDDYMTRLNYYKKFGI